MLQFRALNVLACAALGAALWLGTCCHLVAANAVDCRSLGPDKCNRLFHKCQLDLAWPKRWPPGCISKQEAQVYADRLVIPGLHEKTPIPGAIPDTNDELMAVTEGMFDEDFLAVIDEEADQLAQLAEEWQALPKSKRVTFWMRTDDPAQHSPRFAVEKAVMLVKQALFPNGEDRELGIIGAKYWIQRRSATDHVNFHYDKDEAMASLQMIMRFPVFGTITYLRDHGAPTVLFKQTVVRNGNVEVPRVPTTTWVVQPKRNRHVVQRGDLHHGADPTLATVPVPPGDYRYTLVITWWDYTPLEPNAHRLSDAELPPGLAKDVRGLGGLSPERRVSSFEVLDMGPNNTARRARIATSRVNEAVSLDLPEMLPGGAYELHHHGSGSGGKVQVVPARFDWQQLLRSDALQVIVVYGKAAHQNRAVVLTERVAKRVLNPSSTAMEFSVAHSTALSFFKFVPKDARLPLAIAYSKHRGGFFLTDEQADLPLSKESLWGFVKGVVLGKRRPLDWTHQEL